MRLARRALVAALATMMVLSAAYGQTLRQEKDPRNQAPTVGTGGSPGGPTGLFTIYDGDTLRRGEFTFSIAYSNYDRDPGNVDITEIPLSFNLGLSDHVEIFYNTDGYRGVKVNNPQNLSSFYLPNSRCSPTSSAPPITLENLGAGGPGIILARESAARQPSRISSPPGATSRSSVSVRRRPRPEPRAVGQPDFHPLVTAGRECQHSGL